MADAAGRGDSGEGNGLELARRGALAIATLGRPARRNAISRAMHGALRDWYPRLARDPGIYAVVLRSGLEGVFSVGGDVREIMALAEADPAAARVSLGEELQLCWLHECFSKPTVALIDGIVMGTGVGITLYGTHRLAGEGYRFSMPETAIGYFPDCGTVHAFSRMPHAIGIYLGLTGAEVGPADALALGLVTHVVGRDGFAAIERHLADADPVDPVVDAGHRAPGPGPLVQAGERIAHYFAAPGVAEILARLAAPRPGEEAWAAATLERLRSRSPQALCVTFRAIARAATLDIREALRQDYRLAWRLADDADFMAGVRAVLVDKRPVARWKHARVEDVDPAAVEALFEPLGANELDLPTRAEMQAARV